MWSLILWSIAPIFDALMDTLENENYTKSIFYRDPMKTGKLDPKAVKWNQFWYKRESWNHTPEILSYSIDGWHIAKSLMLAFFAGSGVAAYFEHMVITQFNVVFNIFIELGLRCIIWGVVFELFYSKIFRSKHAQS